MKFIFALSFCLLSMMQAAQAGEVLAHIKSAKVLRCAANSDAADYSKFDTHGNMVAFGADICKAVAVAVLGPGARTDFSAYPDIQTAMIDLRAGKIDLFIGATPDREMAKAYRVSFGPAIFMDGQGFLAAKSANIRKLEDFAHKQICFIGETPFEDNLTAVLGRGGINYMPFPFEEQGEMEAALVTGHCAAVTGDLSKLMNTLAAFRRRARDFEIIPQLISQDPLAPVYRRGDADFASLVKATTALLIKAERDQISRQDAMSGTVDPNARLSKLTRDDATISKSLDLDPNWPVNVIRAVGNYGELYERDLGAGSPLHLPRGQNTLTDRDGSIHAASLSNTSSNAEN